MTAREGGPSGEECKTRPRHNQLNLGVTNSNVVLLQEGETVGEGKVGEETVGKEPQRLSKPIFVEKYAVASKNQR